MEGVIDMMDRYRAERLFVSALWFWLVAVFFFALYGADFSYTVNTVTLLMAISASCMCLALCVFPCTTERCRQHQPSPHPVLQFPPLDHHLMPWLHHAPRDPAAQQPPGAYEPGPAQRIEGQQQ